MIVLSAIVVSYAASVVSADAVELSVIPDKCISLVKGQTCYQRVQFSWKSMDDIVEDKVICLWREGDSIALSCWEEEVEGDFKYELEAAETTNFYLVAGRERQPILSRATVKISWVYSNRASRSSRWRLF